MPAPPPCRLVSCPKFISGAWCACPAPLPPGQLPEIHFGRPVCLPAPLPPGQLPEIHFGRPVCLLRSAAAWSVARNSFRASSVPALPPCRLVCLPRPAAAWSVARNSFRASSVPARPAAAWSVARNSFRASSVPALPPCRLVCLPRPAAAWSVARNSFRASSVPAPPLPPGQSPEIHFGRPVCLPRPAASVARNSLRASSMPAPPRCVSRPKFISGVQCACTARLRQLPEIHFGRPVCLPRPAASVARNSFRASSVPAPPRCVSRPKFIAGVQCACPAPLRQSPEIHCGRPVCLPRPAASVRPKFIAGVQCACPAPLPPGQSYPKCISGAWCACPAPLPPGQLPEIHFGRPVCLPRPAAAWSVTRNVFRAPGVPAPPRCRLVSCPKFISGVQCACPAPLSQRTIFTPPAPAAI
jgi:hypothetical protein